MSASNQINALRQRIATTKTAGVASPAATPAPATTSNALDQVRKLAAATTGATAAAQAAADPKAAATPTPPAKLTDEQVIKLASEKVNKDTIESFEKFAYTIGVLTLASENGYKTAHELIAKAKGAEVATDLMNKAAHYQQAVHQQLEAEELALHRQAQAEAHLKQAFVNLPKEEQEYVKRANAAIAAQSELLDKRLYADLAVLETTKSASEEDKAGTADFLIRRHALLKAAMAGGASDAMAMMDEAGPEGENLEGASLPGSDLNAEGIPEDLTPEQLIELIDMAVQNGDIPPEVGEQMKAQLLQGAAETPEGPGAEDAKAAAALAVQVTAKA